MTREEQANARAAAWDRSAEMRRGIGVSRRSDFKVTALLHILSDLGGEPMLWCSGAPATPDRITDTQRCCPKCQALAMQEAEEWAEE